MIHGDCLEVMAAMDPESVDAIVTDPPYGLEFMGKEWDKLDGGLPQEAVWKGRRGRGGSSIGTDDSKPQSRHHVGYGGTQQGFKRCSICGKRAFSGSPCQCAEPVWVIEYAQSAPSSAIRMGRWHQRWAEAAYRVAKPSAYLLAFGGTRTVHRMTCAIEDAGWIVRDMLVWGYASGFPKGRANLKPAWEPIVMARKPGPLRMLAIDACRIGRPEGDRTEYGRDNVLPPIGSVALGDFAEISPYRPHESGRWPANLILTDPIFDGGWDGVVGGGETYPTHGTAALSRGRATQERVAYSVGLDGRDETTIADSGTYSRFFLIPKAARSDREPVLGGLASTDRSDIPFVGIGAKYCGLCGEAWINPDGWPRCGHGREHTLRRPPLNPKPRANLHPTVKPVDLMRHLVRLVTPPGGIVLDPFLGSGTTALAAEMEGFAWVGIEKEAEYVAIAEARLNGTQRGLAL